MLIRRLSSDEYAWFCDSEEANGRQGSLAQFATGFKKPLHDGDLSFIVPAEKMFLTGTELGKNETKILQQTVPFALEEYLLDKVENLHFCFGPIRDGQVPVFIIAKQVMAEYLGAFSRQNIQLKAFFAEILLLPWQSECWTLVVENERWLVRYGEFQGFALEAEAITLPLQLLLDSKAQAPERLIIYAHNSDKNRIIARLPTLLREPIEWRSGSYWAFMSSATTLNLLQGPYAHKLPWKSWWRQWRAVAALFLVATVMALGLKTLKVKTLEEENITLHGQIEQIYRSVVPEGVIIDPVLQLRRKLNTRKGAATTGFVALLDRTAPIMMQISGLTIESLHYDEKKMEIQLTMLTENFKDAEIIRAKLENSGLQAELTGSSRRGDKNHTGLRVRG